MCSDRKCREAAGASGVTTLPTEIGAAREPSGLGTGLGLGLGPALGPALGAVHLSEHGAGGGVRAGHRHCPIGERGGLSAGACCRVYSVMSVLSEMM